MAKKQSLDWRILILRGLSLAAILSVLIFCFFLVRSINSKMNESATSNLLNTTRVIEDTMEGLIAKDLDSLAAVGELYKSGDQPKSEQLQALCNALDFDWLSIADRQGSCTDSLGNSFQAKEFLLPETWPPQEKGFSDAYTGQLSGREQIMLWVPLELDEQYVGTVFGSVLLSKYYTANIFTFYEGEGRTYLIEGDSGEWILKSLGTDGTSVRQHDIFSLLAASGNNEQEVDAFHQAIGEQRSGTVIFNFNGEESYLCFLPLQSSKGWYLITVIAKDILLRESHEVQRMINLVVAIITATLIVTAIVFIVWLIRRRKVQEAEYREALFANVSANLDSAFLLYERDKQKSAFVSDNVQRLFDLKRSWLAEDTGNLFDWCHIPKDDPQRKSFLSGTLDQIAVREVCVADGLDFPDRYIRLELIPADLNQEIAVLTDITKDKEIQSSLTEAMHRAEAASTAKNNFLSAMSHDIRTPINGVVGMTAIAAAHLDDKLRLQDCLAKINKSTEHLLNLINEVLDMSQIESGKMELSSEPFNIAGVLQDVLNMSYTTIQRKEQTVNAHIYLMEHEEVLGDPARLSRIIANLLSNAIKYTPSNGTITLTLQEKPSMIQDYGCYELIVQDTGIGMSQEFQKKLFEPFEREEDARISQIQGTGLGMSIVKSLVSLMMGSIQVESEKGRGSTFRVMVNLQLADQELEQTKRLKALPVLVVDDDIITCETVTDILRDIGMLGEWTDTGSAAVQKAAERSQRGADYLAVLLDWRMPEMDGVETARRIRAEAGPNIPIIILTAYDWSEIEEEAREAGINDFMTKPIYKSKLLRKMAELTHDLTSEPSPPNKLCQNTLPPGKRILLAEDNVLNTEIAVELLRMMGVEAVCAVDGAAAVELFKNSEPGNFDLILMDIQMPKMNGYEAAQAIRGLERPDSALVPIIAMTADAFKHDEQAAYAAGMNAHLSKPISIERLKQLLIRFLPSSADAMPQGKEEVK